MRPIRITLGLTVLVAVLAAGWSLSRPVAAEPVPPVVTLDEGNLRFTYHVLSGTESLFDVRVDPTCLDNLAPRMPETARVLREHLERDLGVADLAVLRDPGDEHYRNLHGLGYLQ